MQLLDIFDLSKNEEKVLTVFIEKGSLTTGDVTKLTGISRPNCYDLLNKLIEKGLITRLIHNNQVRYSVNSLNYEEIIHKKETELNLIKKNLIEYNNKVQIAKKSNQYDMQIYTGNKGLYNFFKQAIDTKKITTFGAEGILEKKYPAVWDVWIRKLIEQKISLYVIYNEKNRKLRKERKIEIIKERYIERDIFTNVTTQIFDNQVNLFHWQEIPLLIVIKNKEIAKSYRQEFELMWKHAKK